MDVHPNSIQLWIRYIHAEIQTRNINHARNLLDRATTRLPRESKLWYKYVYMEEMLGDIPKTRQVFDRWSESTPPDRPSPVEVLLLRSRCLQLMRWSAPCP